MLTDSQKKCFKKLFIKKKRIYCFNIIQKEKNTTIDSVSFSTFLDNLHYKSLLMKKFERRDDS